MLYLCSGIRSRPIVNINIKDNHLVQLCLTKLLLYFSKELSLAMMNNKNDTIIVIIVSITYWQHIDNNHFSDKKTKVECSTMNCFFVKSPVCRCKLTNPV